MPQELPLEEDVLMTPTQLLDIKNLMDCMGWTAEKAMDSLKIPQDQRVTLYMDLSRNA